MPCLINKGDAIKRLLCSFKAWTREEIITEKKEDLKEVI